MSGETVAEARSWCVRRDEKNRFQIRPRPSMALDGAIRAALITNFRHKLQCKEDLQTEAVVELFPAWQK
jgi:hypothetical protein